MKSTNETGWRIRRPGVPVILFLAVVALAALAPQLLHLQKPAEAPPEPTAAVNAEPTEEAVSAPATEDLAAYAEARGLTLADWPPVMQELYEKNPDARQFVLEYPSRKNDDPVIDLTAEAAADGIPSLYQWDPRWGYRTYIGNFLGLSGCAPTSMSMAILGLTGNAQADPWTLAQYAEANGHYEPGNGTSWSFITSVGPLYGVDVREIGLDQNLINSELDAGHIVCVCVGPGDFTEYGHYFLIVGAEDGQYRIHDPNSVTNSNKLWEYDRLAKQTLCLWALSAAN